MNSNSIIKHKTTAIRMPIASRGSSSTRPSRAKRIIAGKPTNSVVGYPMKIKPQIAERMETARATKKSSTPPAATVNPNQPKTIAGKRARGPMATVNIAFREFPESLPNISVACNAPRQGQPNKRSVLAVPPRFSAATARACYVFVPPA